MPAMTLRRAIIGNKIFFAREGDVIDGITVSALAKPDIDPVTNWLNIGCIEDATINREVTREEVNCFEPGAGYVLEDEIPTSKKLQIDITANHLSNLAIETMFMNDGVIGDGDAGLNYSPMSGDGKVRGWFKLQQYNQTDVTPFHVLDFYGYLVMEGSPNIGNAVFKPTYRMTVVANPLNSGALYTLPVT